MSDDCPDNSTACLLRLIIDQNSGYNWNPLTFGFTAIFTVIALVVSVVTLFQAFIAASPARLKAGERAIGPREHQKRARTEFSWKEFRFRTIVNVPVIEINKILEHGPAIIPIGQQDYKLLDVSAAAQVVSGWSRLLYELSLADIEFNTIQCLTDYLPDDIPAAPAWSRMETIVLLSVMKGCMQLRENEDGFISATGPLTQLSWNVNPNLGPIAIYRTWNVKETVIHELHEVQNMLPVFRGELYLAGSRVLKLMERRRNDVPVVFDFFKLKEYSYPMLKQCHHKHDHCAARKNGAWEGYLASKSQDFGDGVEKRIAALTAALFADRPFKPKGFPSGLTKMQPALKSIYDEFFPWLLLADDFDDSILNELCGSSYVEFDEWDATVDTSNFTGVNLASWLPVLVKQDSKTSDSSLIIERPSLRYMDLKAPSRHSPRSSQQMSREKIEGSGLRMSRTAVQNVSKWLADDAYFRTTSPTEQVKVREWLMWQLTELDWFLSTMDHDAVCAASNLVALGCVKFGLVQVTKIPRRFVLAETLDAFNLTWMVNPADEGSILINGYVDHETLHGLYAYSRNYIEKHRKDLHTVKCTKTTQGYYYAKNKRAKSEPLPDTTKPVHSGTDAMLDANSPVDDELKMTKTPETGAAPYRFISHDEAEMQSKPSPDEIEAIQEYMKSGADIRTPFPEPGTGELIERTESSEDEVAIKIDRRVAALEALTFFRACVFAALLATGADTSIVLISEKRHQLVQVG